MPFLPRRHQIALDIVLNDPGVPFPTTRSRPTLNIGQIGIASEMISVRVPRRVKKPETINYRTLKPERDGLFW